VPVEAKLSVSPFMSRFESKEALAEFKAKEADSK
jgi:hypothetical protein